MPWAKRKIALQVSPLIERLLNDKLDSVRSAAAVALGEIGDETLSLPWPLFESGIGVTLKRSKKIRNQRTPLC